MADSALRALALRVAQRVGAASPGAQDATEAWLASALDAARSQWPGVRLDDTAFVDHLCQRLGSSASEVDLEQLRADDLFLACACGHGDPRAIAVLTEQCRPMLRRVFANPSARGVDSEDLEQVLLERLLIGSPEGSAKILEYGGRGRLSTWIKVAASRLRIDSERRRSDKGAALDEPALARLEAAVGADMERSLLQQRYRAAFKEAFAEALRSLSPEHRNLLRLTVVEGLSATQVARLRGVHRATAKRWLAQVRALLLHDTERNLMERFGIEEADLPSVLRLVRTNLEVSMCRHLEDAADE